MANSHILRYAVILVLIASFTCHADEVKLGLGDVSDGSRSSVVHNIKLYNDQGFGIYPGGFFDQPFSTIQTCGRCHNYDLISSGRHFNSTDKDAAPGRAGQPWIYWDASTATQIPLSWRSWPGTYKPEQLGLSKWWFTRTFGRHLPGGDAGVQDPAEPLDAKDGWPLSGNLEINCLACHDAEPFHDQAAYTREVSKHNFRWAATATCAFAQVKGSVKSLPDSYLPGDESPDAPAVSYDEARFFPAEKVHFNFTANVPNERCYFCHSTKHITSDAADEDETDFEDVHLSAGLNCVDCHRNGIDHAITRGYEEKTEDSQQGHTAVVFSCKQCHMPDEHDASPPMAGTFAAPIAKHKGLPLVHFEKLTCTACHSGPAVAAKTGMAKTSFAHALGTHGTNKAPDALPHILSPVFAPLDSGQIAPHNMVWPAFWGCLKDNEIIPMLPEEVEAIAGKILYLDTELESASWPEMTVEVMTDVLNAIASQAPDKGKGVYISGGKLFSLVDGKVVAVEHDAAKPYSWPIAHNVRPAAQSLGVDGCGDCHATDSPFFFGEVAIDSPLSSQQGAVEMVEFMGLDRTFTKAFAFSFVFRPWMKITALLCCGILAAVILLYALRALACVVKALK